MLKNTFSHIDGISEKTEQQLWEEGINSWEDFLEKHLEISTLPQSKLNKIKQELIFSQHHLELQNLEYFSSRLPVKEHWRCANYGRIAYVDIETTGLSKYTDKITTIGIYDGDKPKIFVRGKDLDRAFEYLEKFDIIVTFNGKQFDIPFIEYHFKNKVNAIHLDLRFMLKEFGFSGGLKKIELALGISRPEEVENMTGFEAVKLWKRYEYYNDIEALDKLILYNIEDIVNLEKLLEYYIKEKIESKFNILIEQKG